MDRYAVMGNPIAHSKSPEIHARFAEQTGQAMEYTKIHVALDGFAEAVQAFRKDGGKGLNVTVPFKQEAWALANRRAPRAEKAGAVNTLVLEDRGRLYGDNTDGIGLVRDLRNNLGVEPAGQRILIIGAGGAVRGVLPALIGCKPASLTVANRTVERAAELATLFADEMAITACGFTDLAARGFDLVINATSAGLSGELPPIPAALFTDGAAAYDMVYGAAPTAFLRFASNHGATRTQDGLGMLVEQAAESFYIWRGVRPDTGPVIAALRG